MKFVRWIIMKNKNLKPPHFAVWLLRRFSLERDRDSLLDDLEFEYNEFASERNRLYANLWYLSHLLRAVPELAVSLIYWKLTMFKNYLKIAIRNIERQKVCSILNILGLTIGVTFCILILLYVQYEKSYDKFHEDFENIYRVTFDKPGQIELNATTFGTLAPALKADFPEIRNTARIRRLEHTIRHKNNLFSERNFFFADPQFFDVFTFPLVSGDYEKTISEPFTILITEKMAKKYFGSENPIGKTLLADNKDKYTITGVIKNPPENSHFHFDFLASFVTLNSLWKDDPISWMNTKLIMTYVKLKKGTNPEELEKKLPEFLKKYRRDDVVLHFQPITDIHLYSNIKNEIEQNSNIYYIYLLSVLAFLLILIACFNYMNLSTAGYEKRLKEIEVRKVLGSKRSHIITQFFGESMVYALTALVVSCLLVILFLPVFNSLVDRNINLTFFGNSELCIVLLGLTVLVGFLSGSYPAFFLSAFQPFQIKMRRNNSSFFRHSLIVFQFVISIVCIIGTVIVNKQLNYMKNKNLGFEKDHIVMVDINDGKLKNSLEPLRNELTKHVNITGTTFTSEILSEIDALNGGFRWEGQEVNLGSLMFYSGFVDYDFLDFFGIELVQGRNFSNEIPSDAEQAYILNETAVKAAGLENPCGKRFGWRLDGEIIGVIKDFHHLSLHSNIGPTILMHINKESDIEVNHMFIKLDGQEILETINYIETKFKEYSPNFPFAFIFLDERIDGVYRSERKLSQMLNYFSFIVIFIACLGLFGLASFTAVQKTKELAIRKVLGASVKSILFMLCRNFLKWIILASCIAFPIAAFTMNSWLKNFAYKTELNIWLFIFSGLAALFIALLTIGYQTIKAATANPVDSIRYE